MASTSTAPNTADPTSCSCKHSEDMHYLIRCGCPNDRPTSHPMHVNDDAFHRAWCGGCNKYCYKDPDCPQVLPTIRMVRSGIHRFIPMYVHLITYPLSLANSASARKLKPFIFQCTYREVGFLSAVRRWVRKRSSSLLFPRFQKS